LIIFLHIVTLLDGFDDSINLQFRSLAFGIPWLGIYVLVGPLRRRVIIYFLQVKILWMMNNVIFFSLGSFFSLALLKNSLLSSCFMLIFIFDGFGDFLPESTALIWLTHLKSGGLFFYKMKRRVSFFSVFFSSASTLLCFALLRLGSIES